MPPENAATVDLHLWIARIKAGDRAARDELLRGFERRLHTLAARMLRRDSRVSRWVETGDVLQSAALRLLRALEHVTPESMRDFFNLAALQIRRELIDLARQYYGAEGIAAHHDSQAAIGSSFLVNQANPESAQLEQWTRFHEEVEKLPSEEREIVCLLFYHGWTQAQAAEFFEVNIRTVRRWWQSALLKLHGVLNAEMLQE